MALPWCSHMAKKIYLIRQAKAATLWWWIGAGKGPRSKKWWAELQKRLHHLHLLQELLFDQKSKLFHRQQTNLTLCNQATSACSCLLMIVLSSRSSVESGKILLGWVLRAWLMQAKQRGVKIILVNRAAKPPWFFYKRAKRHFQDLIKRPHRPCLW